MLSSDAELKQLSAKHAQILYKLLEERKRDGDKYAEELQAELKTQIGPLVDDTQSKLKKFQEWFFKIPTMFRLFFAMTDRWLSFFKLDFLPERFGILSFAIYGLELAFSLGKLAYYSLRNVVRPDLKSFKTSPTHIWSQFKWILQKEGLSKVFKPNLESYKRSTARIWSRFKLAIQKEGLLSDIANTIVWTPLNFATYMLIGVVAGVRLGALTVVGLTYDLLHTTIAGSYDIYTSLTLKRKLQRELAETHALLIKAYANVHHITFSKNPAILAKQINAIKNIVSHGLHNQKLIEKIKGLEGLIPKAKENVETVTQNRVWNMTMSLGVAVSFALSIPLWPIAPWAAAGVLIFGCVLSGLGKRVFDESWKFTANYFAAHAESKKLKENNKQDSGKNTKNIQDSLKNNVTDESSVTQNNEKNNNTLISQKNKNNESTAKKAKKSFTLEDIDNRLLTFKPKVETNYVINNEEKEEIKAYASIP